MTGDLPFRSRNARRKLRAFMKAHEPVARRNADKMNDPDSQVHLILLTGILHLNREGLVTTAEVNAAEKAASEATGIPLADLRILGRFSTILVECFELDAVEMAAR